MLVSPHKVSVDKEGNLWLADNGGHQVFKLNQDGKVLVTLGRKGAAGPGLDQFDAPTDVAIAPNGDIFVGDGHNGGGTATGNARIMKFDKNGKFIKTWGKKGMGPGEFDVIHTLAFDSKAGCSLVTVRTTEFRSLTRTASSSPAGSSLVDRAAGTST